MTRTADQHKASTGGTQENRNTRLYLIIQREELSVSHASTPMLMIFGNFLVGSTRNGSVSL